jgi:D-alanine-D-alanine ligase
LDEPADLVRLLERTAKRVYRTLGLDGYARIDFRMDDEGKVFALEANPNPEIADGQEMAEAAKSSNIEYPALLQRILALAHRRRAAN